MEIEVYSSFYSEPHDNGKFQFSNNYIDALIPFLNEYHLREKNEYSLKWFDSNEMPVKVQEDFEEYWEFVN